jgi:signal peptidase I
MQDLFVKRLIGLPGDKIQIINDLIYINDNPIERLPFGEVLDEQGVRYLKYKEILPEGKEYWAYKLDVPPHLSLNEGSTSKTFYIPEDHYFFLGDNRDNSRDSRFELGYVPFRNLVSRARFIIFSTREIWFREGRSALEELLRVIPWIGSIRTERIFHVLD